MANEAYEGQRKGVDARIMVIGPLQFAEPWWLVLIPVLSVLVVLIARRSISGLGPIVRSVSIGVRLLVIVLVAAALAEPSWRDEAKDVALAVVLDRSSSMPEASNDVVRRYIDEALSNSESSTSRLGVVTTAASPRIETVPVMRILPTQAWQRLLASGFSVGDRDATDLGSAVRAALAVIPGDAGGRLLVVSDGNETSGSLLSAAEHARAKGVPIDVLPIRYEIEREVVLERLVAPAEARMGEQARLRFVIRSTHETTVELALEADGRVMDLDPSQPGLTLVERVRPGVNVIERPIRVDTQQPLRFTGTIRTLNPGDDAIAENNRAMAVTFVHGRGSVLIYTNNFAEAQQLAAALRDAEIDVQIAEPATGPASVEALQEYAAVVLMNVSAGDFSIQGVRDLARYVADTGGGLVMIGGPRSFGAGGWNGTDVAEVLPVLLDPPQRRELPRGALALVIDASGSMMAGVGGSRLTQMDVAKAGAIAGKRALSDQDLLTVISFSAMYRVDVPLQENASPGIESAINRMNADGGTNMWPAIDHARQILVGAAAGQKHIVLLSDGHSMGGDEMAILRRLQRDGITLSAIAVGDGADVRTLNNLALAAGGTFYSVRGSNGIANLPQLFIKEAQIVRRALIWEGDPFQPIVTDRSVEPMRNMPAALPAVSGYIITADREGLSQVTARAPNEDADPIVAQWQFGLGRAMVFTSDATTRWSTDWTTWSGFRAFWDQHIRWVMRPTGSADVHTVLQTEGDRTRVIMSAVDGNGEPMDFARFSGRVLGPGGKAERVEIVQTGPGRYEGSFASGDAGAYLFASSYEGGSGEAGAAVSRGTVLAATTRAFADEHLAERDNTALLLQVAEMTGGRVLRGDVQGENLFLREGVTMPVALTPLYLLALVLAAGLFVADVGVRRVRLDVRAMVAAVRKLAARGAKQKEERIDALKVVRDKARARFSDPQARQQAGRKFEASQEQVAASAHGAGSPLTVERGSSGAAGGAKKPAPVVRAAGKSETKEEEEGMARLLSAKRRARDAIVPDSSKEHSSGG